MSNDKLTAEEIDILALEEIIVETNAGTYSAHEAHTAIGVGDPQFADYYVWERVGDSRRRTSGCDPDRAPGRARRFRGGELAKKRKRLATLRKQLKKEG